ncbi:SDR family NAD(P)-dependent oxidoreductase [Pseudomonas californiensis]|uniref:SDR family NAD(P)-dependent oxidoreductase n=1 Tax=Pseudomonas californiensis TaxID=2829823 RepID=UPI001E561FE9|nr:SDR family NAD(P)-dependent oxidoreductase [Pseudomonas californiensis]
MSKVWFITGTTRGLGTEIAKAALATGDKVVATGRDVTAVIKALGEHDKLLPVALDVTDETQAVNAISAAVEKFGKVDVVVNNAGYAVLGALEELTDAEVREQFETNVFGLLNVTRAALPVLRTQGRGHVINISSVAGYHGGVGASAYCATKYAVEGITECLALEVAPFGLDVTVVEPGYFRTDFLSSHSVRFAEKVIDDYAQNPAGSREAVLAVHGKQANDPKKLA